MACTTATCGDVVCGDKCVDQNLALAFLHAKRAGVAERVFTVRWVRAHNSIEDQQGIQTWKIKQLPPEAVELVG